MANIEEKLRESEENFRIFFETIDDLIFIADEKGKILHVNGAVMSKLGYSLYELENMHILDVHPQDVRDAARVNLADLFTGIKDHCSLPLISKNGIRIPVITRVWFGKWNSAYAIFVLSKDISSEQAALQKFNKLFDHNPSLMAISDMKTGVFTDVNSTFLMKLGYKRSEIIGKTSEDLNLFVDKILQKQAKSMLLKNNTVRDFEIKIRKKSGETLDALFSGEIIDNQIERILLTVMIDITERKKAHDKIEYLSYHDKLTGLFNRRFFEEELARLDTVGNLPLSVIMADVNGLKMVNDSFGHKIGDELLIKAAHIIKSSCRSYEIVARLGGDEFVILLPKTSHNEVENILNRIKNSASEYSVEGIDISISFGYACKDSTTTDIHKILKRAEDQMYKNKLYESSSTKSKMITLMMNTLYQKSSREKYHSLRVKYISELIASELNLGQDFIKKVGIAGLMHDIGKVGVDEKILSRQSGLSGPEWDEIKRHPEIGYRILSMSNEFSEIAQFVLEHQEKYDGTGYPRGLKHDEICLQSKIIAVAGAFDAMTGEKTYRKPVSICNAINEIKNNSGTHFDPQIVEILVRIFNIRYSDLICDLWRDE